MNATLQQYLQAYQKARADLLEYRRNVFKPGDRVRLDGGNVIAIIENYPYDVEFINVRISAGGAIFGIELKNLEKI